MTFRLKTLLIWHIVLAVGTCACKPAQDSKPKIQINNHALTEFEKQYAKILSPPIIEALLDNLHFSNQCNHLAYGNTWIHPGHLDSDFTDHCETIDQPFPNTPSVQFSTGNSYSVGEYTNWITFLEGARYPSESEFYLLFLGKTEEADIVRSNINVEEIIYDDLEFFDLRNSAINGTIGGDSGSIILIIPKSAAPVSGANFDRVRVACMHVAANECAAFDFKKQ